MNSLIREIAVLAGKYEETKNVYKVHPAKLVVI